MSVKVFKTSSYRTTHENLIFDNLLGKLKDTWKDTEELVLLFGNFYSQGNEIDAAILKRNSLTIIDFKDYDGVIKFSENGSWFADDVEVKGGGSPNPYLQMRKNRFAFMDELKNINFPSRHTPNLGHISGLVLFHRPITFDERQLPPIIDRWFHVVDFDHTIDRLSHIVSAEINLTNDDLLHIANHFAIPEYTPIGSTKTITTETKIPNKCSRCGATNSSTAKFCNECGDSLFVTPKLSSEETIRKPKSTVSPKFLELAKKLENKRKADILFVLDCTGSMQGEIDAIKDAIMDFADEIKSHAITVRVGLIEFRDRLIHEEHRALTFDGEIFTENPELFRNEVAKLKAGGGGDEPESSLDALMFALDQPFNPEGQKVIVLVTDAPPHIPDKDTQNIEAVTQKIQTVGINQLHLVIRTQDSKSSIYFDLLKETRGLAFEIGQGEEFRKRAENFKQTLHKLGETISATICL